MELNAGWCCMGHKYEQLQIDYINKWRTDLLVAIKHNVKKQPLAQESPNGILDSGGQEKKKK